jgi:hypothetical protein
MKQFSNHTRLGLASLCAAMGLMGGLGVGVTAHAAPTLSSALTCGAKQVTQVPAPGAKQSATFAAGVAGQVKLLQIDTLTLNVQSVTPSSGWTDTVTVSAGSSVRVNFFGPKTRQVRFDGRFNPTYTRLTVTVVSCH